MAQTRDRKRTTAHVLAVCNGVGFAVLFGFAAAMNRVLRAILEPFDAMPEGWTGRMMLVPFWAWAAAVGVSLLLLALIQGLVRGGKAGIVVQTAIGVLQLGALTIYGAWALWLLFRTLAAAA